MMYYLTGFHSLGSVEIYIQAGLFLRDCALMRFEN